MNVYLYEGDEAKPRIGATASISDAGVSGEDQPHQMHEDDLDCSEATGLVEVGNVALISDAHELSYPYLFHATDDSEVPWQMGDMVLEGLYACNMQAMNGIAMASNTKTVPKYPTHPLSLPLKEAGNIHAADVTMSQEIRQPINVKLFDIHQYGDHGWILQLNRILEPPTPLLDVYLGHAQVIFLNVCV